MTDNELLKFQRSSHVGDMVRRSRERRIENRVKKVIDKMFR